MSKLVTRKTLLIIVVIVLLIIVLLGIFRPSTGLTAGVDMSAHLGGVSGSLNLETFEGQVGGVNPNDAPTVAFFKANWCGHCKNAYPEFEKVMKEYQGPLKLVVVDIDKDKQLAEKCGVSSVPTCRYYKSFPPSSQALADFIEYSGERTATGFNNFLNSVQGVVSNKVMNAAPVS